MSPNKSAWQVGGQTFATVFVALIAAFEPVSAFVLALIATVILTLLS